MSAASGAAAGQVKGAAFREFLRWYAAREGAARLVEHARALPARMQPAFDLHAEVLGVLTTRWYPAELVHALLDQIIAGRSDPEVRALATDGSQAVMDATLRGIYKVLFGWMANPSRYAKHGHRLWRMYYDSGSIDVSLQASGLGAVTVVRNWNSHHPFICDLNRGAAVAIYTAMGCTGVECDRTACVDRGDPECRFITRWRHPPASR